MNLLKRPSCIPRCPNPLCLIWGLLETRRFQCAPIDALLLKSSSTTKKILQSHYWITIEQQMILGLFPQTPINIYHHLPPSTIIYHHLPSSTIFQVSAFQGVGSASTVGCCRSCRAMQRKGLGVPPDGGVGKSLLPKWSLHLISWGWVSGVVENLVEFHDVLSL